jgi:hypothetical protein
MGPHNIVVAEMAEKAGPTADISTYDVEQSNGVVMVVEKVPDAEVRRGPREGRRLDF